MPGLVALAVASPPPACVTSVSDLFRLTVSNPIESTLVRFPNLERQSIPEYTLTIHRRMIRWVDHETPPFMIG